MNTVDLKSADSLCLVDKNDSNKCIHFSARDDRLLSNSTPGSETHYVP